MLYVIKILISVLIIFLATELSKRSSTLAAVVLSLPLVSILALCWIYVESRDTAKIASVSQETFWYVLPTLPMFLVLPYLLRHGYSFYISLSAGAALTIVLFFLTQALISRF